MREGEVLSPFKFHLTTTTSWLNSFFTHCAPAHTHIIMQDRTTLLDADGSGLLQVQHSSASSSLFPSSFIALPPLLFIPMGKTHHPDIVPDHTTGIWWVGIAADTTSVCPSSAFPSSFLISFSNTCVSSILKHTGPTEGNAGHFYCFSFPSYSFLIRPLFSITSMWIPLHIYCTGWWVHTLSPAFFCFLILFFFISNSRIRVNSMTQLPVVILFFPRSLTSHPCL